MMVAYRMVYYNQIERSKTENFDKTYIYKEKWLLEWTQKNH